MAGGDVLLWMDVETTGLNPWTGDRLLQVACIVTDARLNELDEPRQWVVRHDPDQVERMRRDVVPYVADMHERTGLWGRLADGTELGRVDAEVLELLHGHTRGPRQARLAGSSVKLDFDFVARFLPSVAGWLHYRVVDVTAISFAAQHLGWMGGPEEFVKRKTHDAVDDIRESLEQLRWISGRVLAGRDAAVAGVR